jgi:hypothetical protein
MWQVEFPQHGGKVVRLTVAAPADQESADVIVTMSAACTEAGLKVDPFEATAVRLNPAA